MRVAVSGATGFIGQRVIRELQSRRIEYIVLTRDAAKARQRCPEAREVIEWEPGVRGPAANLLERLDGVVHLAGSTVARRWSAAVKREIRESRIEPTRRLVATFGRLKHPPKVFVSASAVGYYGPRDDTELNEAAPAGDDFLAELAREWEGAAMQAAQYGVRVVTPRIGIVLGPGGGALSMMLTPFRLGVGGPIGDGLHWMPWIHVADVAGLIHFALTTPALTGPVNASAPHPERNRDFARALGRALRRPAVLPAPGFALRLLYGEFASVVAAGQRMIPEKALAAGYHFRYPDLPAALADAVKPES